jgi:hypothetical protein
VSLARLTAAFARITILSRSSLHRLTCTWDGGGFF